MCVAFGLWLIARRCASPRADRPQDMGGAVRRSPATRTEGGALRQNMRPVQRVPPQHRTTATSFLKHGPGPPPSHLRGVCIVGRSRRPSAQAWMWVKSTPKLCTSDLLPCRFPPLSLRLTTLPPRSRVRGSRRGSPASAAAAAVSLARSAPFRCEHHGSEATLVCVVRGSHAFVAKTSSIGPSPPLPLPCGRPQGSRSLPQLVRPLAFLGKKSLLHDTVRKVKGRTAGSSDLSVLGRIVHL